MEIPVNLGERKIRSISDNEKQRNAKNRRNCQRKLGGICNQSRGTPSAGHFRTAKNPVNFGHVYVGKCRELSNLRDTAHMQNFCEFRFISDTSGKIEISGYGEHAELWQIPVSFGHVGQRPAEFMTKTQCFSGDARNILLDVDVG